MNQRSAEWFAARCGKVTASEVSAAMSFLTRKSKNGEKGEESGKRADYKAAIVAEILTGRPDMDGYLSKYMEWGNEYESQARVEYELQTGNSVELAGFVDHPSVARFGASPDGLIGATGGLEIKCPKTETHLRWLIAGGVPEEHKDQMYAGMACTGRSWWDFVSYDPRLPDPIQLFVRRLEADAQKIDEMKAAVQQFNAEVDALIETLMARFGDLSIPKPKPEQTADEMLHDLMNDMDHIIP